MSFRTMVLVAVAVAGCAPVAKCDATNCPGGCCDSSDQCQASTKATCGLAGVACQNCEGAQVCQVGVCTQASSVTDAGIDAGGGDAGLDGGLDAGIDAGPPRDAGVQCTASTKSPRNLVLNPGFECDEQPRQWEGVFTVVSDAHMGTHAARLIADGSGQAALGITLLDSPVGPTTYCATVHAKGTAATVRVDALTSPNSTRFVSPLSSTWSRVPPSTAVKVTVAAGAQLGLTVAFASANPGDTLLIDDVDVWASTTNCADVR